MARRPFNPLDSIPSPDVIRAKLLEAQTLAERLRILLEVSERINQPAATGPLAPQTPTGGKAVPRV